MIDKRLHCGCIYGRLSALPSSLTRALLNSLLRDSRSLAFCTATRCITTTTPMRLLIGNSNEALYRENQDQEDNIIRAVYGWQFRRRDEELYKGNAMRRP